MKIKLININDILSIENKEVMVNKHLDERDYYTTITTRDHGITHTAGHHAHKILLGHSEEEDAINEYLQLEKEGCVGHIHDFAMIVPYVPK